MGLCDSSFLGDSKNNEYPSKSESCSIFEIKTKCSKVLEGSYIYYIHIVFFVKNNESDNS